MDNLQDRTEESVPPISMTLVIQKKNCADGFSSWNISSILLLLAGLPSGVYALSGA